MGEISEMMLEGILCQECGVYIQDDDAAGFPRYCVDCGGDPETSLATKRRKPRGKIACPLCRKRFKTEQGLADHKRDKHGM